MCSASSDTINSLDELVAGFAQLQSLTLRLATAVRRFERSGEWAFDGSVSMAAWMRHNLRITHAEANRWLRQGRFLTSNPIVTAAAETGAISLAQVAALQANVTPATAAVFHDHQQVLVDAIRDLNVADTHTLCHEWAQRAEATVDQPAPAIPERSFTSAALADGTTVGNFVLDAAGAAQLDQALQTATHFDGTNDTRTPTRRRADAFVDILQFFNANHHHQGTPRHRPHVELTIHAQLVDTDTSDPFNLGEIRGFHLNGRHIYLRPHAYTTRGGLLPECDTDAHLCDCVIHRVIKADNNVLDYGRATRTVPQPLFRAVACRDGGCRFPGCNRPTAWCDAHHITHWRANGQTKLDNLILLCGYHHHLIHRHNWTITLHSDATATFTPPTGAARTSRPRGQPTIRDPIAA